MHATYTYNIHIIYTYVYQDASYLHVKAAVCWGSVYSLSPNSLNPKPGNLNPKP